MPWPWRVARKAVWPSTLTTGSKKDAKCGASVAEEMASSSRARTLQFTPSGLVTMSESSFAVTTPGEGAIVAATAKSEPSWLTVGRPNDFQRPSGLTGVEVSAVVSKRGTEPVGAMVTNQTWLLPRLTLATTFEEDTQRPWPAEPSAGLSTVTLLICVPGTPASSFP